MTPPKKPEGPVDTSSRVSTEAAEASLEGIPASISPIATVSRTRNVTPPADELELQTNANKALEDFLSTKASIDACRWRAIWDLSIALYQSESQAAESIEAKAGCSLATLDAYSTCSQLALEAKTNCSRVILEAKTACSMAVKKAKTTRGCMVREAEDTCSRAITKVKAQKAIQAKLLQREYGSIMWDLEEQLIQEESRSQADFLSICQVTLYNSPPELKSALATSCHILMGQAPPSPPLALLQRPSLVGKQLTSAAPPTSVPEQSPRPKR